MPERYHPAHYEGLEYVIDTATAVEGMQLTAMNRAEFAAWTGADPVGPINGSTAFLLLGRRPCAERVVGLGDYAMRSGDSWWAERGSGFYQRYARAEEQG